MNTLALHRAILIAGALVAGGINSIACGGMRMSFTLLIWLGLDPKVANAPNAVALWPGCFGGLFGFRRQLADSSTLLVRLGLISIAGGAVGAGLLILTPSLTFARMVPFLILFATILFMDQGPINLWLQLQPIAAKPSA